MKTLEAVEAVTRQPAAHHIAYRPEVDGLRAIAVVSVILFHAGATWPGGGFVGVDIFFVISGYLITSIIANDIAANEFTFLNFYERRIRRIFPALFLVLVMAMIAAYFIYTPRQFKDFGQSLIATSSFTANIYFPMKIGYFAEDTHNVALIHMWSLSVEEQFYVFFPVLMLLLTRVGAKTMSWLLATLAAGSLLWAMLAFSGHSVSMFFWTHTRAWELLAGALLAINRANAMAWLDGRRAIRTGVELGGTVLVAGSILFIHDGLPWPGLAAVPVIVGTVMLLAASRSTTPVGRVLASRGFVLVGLISYSAYLWHQPVFAFTRVSIGRPLTAGDAAGLVVVTFVLAWLSWRYIETPFRSRHRFSRLFVFGSAIAATLMTIGVGAALYIGQGLPQRYNAATRAVADSMTYSPYRDTCHTDGVNHIRVEKACRYFNQKASWAVFGDSEAVELAYALAEMLKPKGEGVLHLSFSGCPAALTYEHPGSGCNEWTRHSLEWLEKHDEITHVMMIYRYSYHLFGDQLKTYPKMPNERPKFLLELSPNAARDRFWESFRTMIDRLRAAGKQVVIIRPVPDLPVPVERYVYDPRARLRGTGMTRAEAETRNAWTNARLDTLENVPNITLIDPRNVFCDKVRCWSIKDGKALYIDDNHPSVVGARYILEDARKNGVLRITAPSRLKDIGAIDE